jgi:hypothetical protein
MPTFVGPRAPSAQPGLGAPYVSTTYVNYNMYALTYFVPLFLFLNPSIFAIFYGFPLFIVPSKLSFISVLLALRHNYSSPLLILSETCFRGKCQSHHFRRRIGDTKGPWEDTSFFKYVFGRRQRPVTDGMNDSTHRTILPAKLYEREPSLNPALWTAYYATRYHHYNKVTDVNSLAC